jgi:UDP-2-acetamido-2,6-beta-L-arabino-hexul-4-ose reductase
MKKVLITGSDGFIGKNLVVRLRESAQFQVIHYNRSCGESALRDLVGDSDFIFHLAGVNRPANVADFAANAHLGRQLTTLMTETGRRIPVVFTSSIQTQLDNAYGRSKREAEDALLAYAAATNSQVYIYSLPNVFGKWSRPNYNSAVATFCYNIARDLPVTINDPNAALFLVYIDDLVEDFAQVLQQHSAGDQTQQLPFYREIAPIYKTTVGEVVDRIRSFRDSRSSLTVDHVGTGLLRALYSTYLSYLPATAFAYPIGKNVDPRGEFAEVLKTLDCGQFSYLTAHPGVTRGGHYHHTKSEKFLVIRGHARFRFRHILDGETAEIETSSDKLQIVETIPGWSHDITNVGQSELIVLLWASEVYDRAHPDTFPWKV